MVFKCIWSILLWREETVRWFKKRQARDPNNPKWASWLGYTYQSRMWRTTGTIRIANAKQVVAYYERWLFLEGEVRHDFSKLDDLAIAAAEAGLDEKAERY